MAPRKFIVLSLFLVGILVSFITVEGHNRQYGFLPPLRRPLKNNDRFCNRWKTCILECENRDILSPKGILRAESKDSDPGLLEKEKDISNIDKIFPKGDTKGGEENSSEEEPDYLSRYFGEEYNKEKTEEANPGFDSVPEEEVQGREEQEIIKDELSDMEKYTTENDHKELYGNSSNNVETNEKIDDNEIESSLIDTNEDASSQAEEVLVSQIDKEESVQTEDGGEEIEVEREFTMSSEIIQEETEDVIFLEGMGEEEDVESNTGANSEPPPKSIEDLELDPLLQHISKGDSNRLETSYTEANIDPDSPEYKKILTLTRQRSYATILIEKGVETFEDIYKFYENIGKSKIDPQHYQRKWKSGQMEKRKKIVVLGTGWGAHSFIQDIDAIANEVTVISPRNFFLFTPMLAASAVGTVESRSISEPIRQVNPYVDYLEAKCMDIDYKNKRVSCESVICEGLQCEVNDFELEYDELVISVGAKTTDYGIPGVKEYAHFLKDLPDAARLRSSIGNCFERANVPGLTQQQRQRQLSFVVVGGGPTGVEFASELRDLICEDMSRFYSNLIPDVSIKLVEASDKVLSMFDEGLQEEALNALESTANSVGRQITDVLLQKGVKQIRESDILLSDESTLPYGVVVWAAGNGPLPLIESLVEKVPEQKALKDIGRGRIVIDPWCRVKGCKGILGIGDCTVNEDAPLPATAQVASQQGSYLARLFNKDCNFLSQYPEIPEKNSLQPLAPKDSDDSSKPVQTKKTTFAKGFQFLNLGVLAYTGSGSALAQVQVDDARIKSSGKVGFLLWRSVYISKQVSLRNRILVALDWTKAKLFGRDITRI